MKVIKVALDKVPQTLASIVEELSNECLKSAPSFKIAVSGGSLIKYLEDGLPAIQTDFSKWLIFFCDERIVPEADDQSTYGAYKTMAAKLNIQDAQFIKIKQGLNTQQTADDYTKQLVAHFGRTDLPQFDLLLLGMGPDGHICSLFPGHPLLQEKQLWVAPIEDSPKPPPQRITLTLPVINHAKCSIVTATGSGKAEMVKKIMNGDDLPAAKVKSQKVYWILDNEAAKELT